MTEECVYLDELNANTRDYKVKIKVVEKGRAAISNLKGTLYQTFIIQDDKDNRMRGTLFVDQIESYKEAFMYNGVYEIANAPIRHCDEKYRSKYSSLPYQMTFDNNTAIQAWENDDTIFMPEYQSIAQLPRTGNNQAKFAVLGIVIFVAAVPRKVVTTLGNELSVREIIISDHSTEQPLLITTWSDLAESCSRTASAWAGQFTVIGFTALRVSAYKGMLTLKLQNVQLLRNSLFFFRKIGFSMSTTMSTEIVYSPEGARAKALTKWSADHINMLADRQARVLEVRNPRLGRKMTTIKALKLKTAKTTLQDERHWLRVTIDAADLDKINAYTSCSICGCHTDVPLGMLFACLRCKCTDCTGQGSLSTVWSVTGRERFLSQPFQVIQASCAECQYQTYTN